MDRRARRVAWFKICVAIAAFFVNRRRSRLFSRLRQPGRLRRELALTRDAISRDHLRMEPSAFEILNNLLKEHYPKDFIAPEEITFIGLQFVGHNPTIREQCFDFGRSNGTVCKSRSIFVSATLRVFGYQFSLNHWIQREVLRGSADSDFPGAIGALDGTHIPFRAYDKELVRYRNRKGDITTNIVILSDFTGRVLACAAGVEGSAHDVFALSRSGLLERLAQLPEQLYVLADAGYGLSNRILVPFRSTRYHLQEFSRTNGPRTPQELFNLRHAQRRNAVERLIGVLKRRFAFLRERNEMLNKVLHRRSIIACCLIHNFLVDTRDSQYNLDSVSESGSDSSDSDGSDSTPSPVDKSDDTSLASERRWRMALRMFDEYQSG